MNTFRIGIKYNENKDLISKWIVISTIVWMVLHTVYMNVMGITPTNRTLCVIYDSLPKWAFYIYEYFFELFIVVLLGIFAGVLIEHFSHKLKRFYPKNQLLAFIYASILPVCSCAVIPMVSSLNKNVNFRSAITFIVAAPLLNPYIVFLSFSVLGIKYAVIRIVASFILAVTTGLILEWIATTLKYDIKGIYKHSKPNCQVVSKNPFRKTMQLTYKILPYIIIAGLLTVTFEYINPKKYLETLSFNLEPVSMLLMLLVGIPIYVCNGTDVIFLQPLLKYTDLSMGSAMMFSLTSSVICISSIIMLYKFLGKKLTISLVITITMLVILFGITINLFT